MDLSKIIKTGATKHPPRLFIYGEEKIGKSSLAASSPSPVFICGEDGLVGPQFDSTQHFTPTNWADVKEFVKTLIAGGHQFKTLVVDTLDWLEPILAAHVCSVGAKKNLEEFGFGKGYIAAADEFRLLLADMERLMKTGVGIIILAHCHIKGFQNPAGDNYDRYEPKCSKQIAGLVKEWSDAILLVRAKVYTHKESAKSKAKGVGDIVRVISTNKTPAWDAGNRYSMPDELPLSWDAIAASIESGRPDSPDAIEAEVSEMIEKSAMSSERKETARAAVIRDHGNANALKLLLNRVRQAA